MELDLSGETDSRVAVQTNTQTLMCPKSSLLFAQLGPQFDVLSQIDPVSISKL